MKDTLEDLEQFLQELLNNYTALPDAKTVEDKINKAVAFKEIMSDYQVRAEHKINVLLADKPKATKLQLKALAESCFQKYQQKNFNHSVRYEPISKVSAQL